MNKDNAKYYLPLVQALADGKSIQLAAYFHYTGEVEGWVDVDELDMKVCATAYRIKPEPLVIYGVLEADSATVVHVSADVNEAKTYIDAWRTRTDGKVRKFVEVVED